MPDGTIRPLPFRTRHGIISTWKEADDMDDVLRSLFRKARQAKGMTLKEVGASIGVTGNGYGKMELGKRKIPTDLIKPLCEALDVSMTDALLAMAGMGDGRPVSVHVPPDRPYEDMFGLPDNGCKILFEPEEWRMHLAIAEFAGLDPLSKTAMVASDKAIFERRRAKAMKNIKGEPGNGT